MAGMVTVVANVLGNPEQVSVAVLRENCLCV